MSLQESLEEIKDGFLKMAPPEAVATMQSAVEGLKNSGILDRVAGVGDRAPDFSLPDPEGRMVSLSGMLAQGPVVLSFYRGKW